ncbi:MAG TPA: hypothetical protein GX692_08505 [Acholeplasmataceae bacterium]|nr:hypothetical protein [Acholeplasmataceae bacterium]
MKKLIVIFLLSIGIFILTGCSNIKYSRHDFKFDLKEDLDLTYPYAKLIRNIEELNEFLADESLFSEELSEEFQNFNTQFNEEFFKENDLIPIIYQTSSSTKAIRIRRIINDNSNLKIVLKMVAPKHARADIYYFTFYLNVSKEEKIKSLNVTVK